MSYHPSEATERSSSQPKFEGEGKLTPETARFSSTSEESHNALDEEDAILHSAIDIGQTIMILADLLMKIQFEDDHSEGLVKLQKIQNLIYEQAEGLRKVRRRLRQSREERSRAEWRSQR